MRASFPQELQKFIKKLPALHFWRLRRLNGGF